MPPPGARVAPAGWVFGYRLSGIAEAFAASFVSAPDRLVVEGIPSQGHDASVGDGVP
jgi:hypothetical protein